MIGFRRYSISVNDVIFKIAVPATDHFLGYLISQYPSGYLLQRFPIAKFIGVTTLCWGILMITTPGCTSFAGIATNRFLLGMTEAVVNPGFVLVRLW